MTENPTPQKGDRVRVTTAFEGEVTEASSGGISIRDGMGVPMTFAWVPPFGTRTVEILAPAEPPVGSVVLDKYGIAWQRLDDSWRSVGDDRVMWADLQYLQPLTVIHRGGDDAE